MAPHFLHTPRGTLADITDHRGHIGFVAKIPETQTGRQSNTHMSPRPEVVQQAAVEHDKQCKRRNRLIQRIRDGEGGEQVANVWGNLL